jgi:hypothetical protein
VQAGPQWCGGIERKKKMDTISTSYIASEGWVIVNGDEATEPMCYTDAVAALMAMGVSESAARSGLATAEEMPASSCFQFA